MRDNEGKAGGSTTQAFDNNCGLASDATLHKPFDHDELIRIVDDLLASPKQAE